jgi:hypothetical protein
LRTEPNPDFALRLWNACIESKQASKRFGRRTSTRRRRRHQSPPQTGRGEEGAPAAAQGQEEEGDRFVRAADGRGIFDIFLDY